MEAGMAECLINMSKIPTFNSECQRDIDEANKKEDSEEKTNTIKANQDQINQNNSDYTKNKNMYRTMGKIVNNMREEYFGGFFGKILFFIIK